MPKPSAPSPSNPPPPHVRYLATPKRRLFADRAARWVVSAGGIAIIASILGILIFILVEVWPLTHGAEVKTASIVELPAAEAPGEILIDEKNELAATLDADGILRLVRLRDGASAGESDLLAALPAPAPTQTSTAAGIATAPAGPGAAARPRLTALQSPADGGSFAAATSDGRVLIQRVDFAGGAGASPLFLPLDPQGRPLGPFSAQLNADGGATAAALLADGKIAIVRRAVETNSITGESTESASLAEVELPGHPTAIVVDAAQDNLYVGTEEGEIHWWQLEAGQPGERRSVPAGAPIRSLALLLGGRSLAVGQEDGALSVWFGVKHADDTARLTRVHEFPKHPGAIRLLAASPRDKGFLAWGGGRLGLYYATSEKTLWKGTSPIAEPTALAYAPKADGALVAGFAPERQGAPRELALARLSIANAHPEVTLRSLFGKVWYEGYEKPEYVWQSSGGTDDFEPKLSLVPLLVGTLKGTFYSLLLAIPLGVFGAMYTSQFMHPRYKRTLKPMIEIMASLPSVVLGFLAGLWLAPRVEQFLPGLLLMAFVLPLLVLLTGWIWNRLPIGFRGRFATGSEAILFVGVLAFGIWLCFQLAHPFERLLFAGDLKDWILRATGLGYDQRNAVVVGLAMGFAVIPIIFAIAEDAFSNVPRNLVAGSLAMGADRWQTVTRVVLPTASPGIFSAIMIGFGRAVGETMIVLMATGNTPIMEWNPFNGFRTLSANIAVEIPEAPHGGSLYRTLFLAALLLFVMTFLVNTVAEVVRQRLRERYSQL